MTKQIISTPNAPQAIGPYSQAVWAGDLLYLSGQIALDSNGIMQNQDFDTEVRQVLANIQAVLTEAQGSYANIVKLTIYLIDFADFQSLNQLMQDALPSPFPARTTIAVSALPKGARVEIEAIAHFAKS